jgi:hypothetical protein
MALAEDSSVMSQRVVGKVPEALMFFSSHSLIASGHISEIWQNFSNK